MFADRRRWFDGTTFVAAALAMFLAIGGSALPVVRVAGYSVWSIHVWWIGGVVTVAYGVWKYTGRRIRFERPLIYLGLFVVFSTLSLLWAYDRWVTLTDLFSLGAVVVIIGLFYLIADSRPRVELVVGALLALVMACLVVASWELATGNHLRTSEGVENIPTALFYNRNDFGLFLALVSPLVLRDALRCESLHARVYAVGVLGLIGWVLWFTSARASMVAAVGSGVTLLVLRANHRAIRERISLSTPIWTVFIAVFAVGLLLLPVVFANPFSQASNGSLWARWQMLRAGGEMFAANPLGVGLDNFSPVAASMPIESGGISSPHHWVPQLLGELGVIGLGLFVLLYGSILDRLFRPALHGDVLAMALFSSLVWVPVSGAGPSDALSMSVVWILFGVAIAYLSVSDRQSSDASDGHD